MQVGRHAGEAGFPALYGDPEHAEQGAQLFLGEVLAATPGTQVEGGPRPGWSAEAAASAAPLRRPRWKSLDDLTVARIDELPAVRGSPRNVEILHALARCRAHAAST